ncbi:MAG: hypothetical protein HDQ87_11915 [Clostridia bacterium]|nr:hypothetical protein [Clostridia bacterium]
MADTEKTAAAVCQEALQNYGTSVMALVDGPSQPAQYLCGYVLKDGANSHIAVSRSAYLSRDAVVGMLGKMLGTYAEGELTQDEIRDLVLRMLQNGPKRA